MKVSNSICFHVMLVKYQTTPTKFVVFQRVRLVVQARLSQIVLHVRTQQIKLKSFRQTQEGNVNAMYPQNGIMQELVLIVIQIA
jgi:hypothetical protein